ncbi:MAG: hypothetical protein H7039_02315 [Bryobacteraceae bacterium]|nr:hypothetical protein [Bryobacteraceae bacterium]
MQRFSTLVLIVLAACLVLPAAESWDKVRELKSGQELRIWKREAKQPMFAKMDEASGESLVVVMKDQQLAVAKDDIDRVEARPAGKTPGIVRESKVSSAHPERLTGPAIGPARNVAGQTVNSSSSVSLGSKPGFELIYRRLP